MRNVLGIVPARGGSKRIKDKNIVDFFGRPIIAYSLDAMRRSGICSEIHVSTDSERIRDVVTGLGFDVPFLREMYADDHAGLLDVVRWVLDRFERDGRSFDDVCLMMPCAPMIESDDLKAAFTAFRADRHQPMLAVAYPPAPPQQALLINADSTARPERPGEFAKRSQDLPETVYDTGTFVYFSIETLRSGKMDRFESWRAFVLPKHKAIDINTPEDLQFAKIVFAGHKALDNGTSCPEGHLSQ